MNITNRILQLYRSKFLLSRSLIVIAGSLLANVFAYLFQIVTGRYFSVEDYSILIALFSVSGIIGIFSQVFMNAIPKIVAEIKDENYPHRISNLYFSILKIKTLFASLVLIIMLSNLKFMGNYLNIHNTPLLVMYSIAVFAGLLFSFNVMFLQGLLRFKAYSFLTLLTAVFKFLVGLTVALLGIALIHVYSGLAVATLVLAIMGFMILRKNISLEAIRSFDVPDVKLLIKYSLGSAFAIMGLNFLQNNDMILVKHFFDASEAGLYASLSVIGKIVFYAASPVGIVMLPICSAAYAKGEDYIKPFLSALGLGALIAGSVVVVYYFFPHLAIQYLFGRKYLPAEPYLPAFAVFTFGFTLLQIVMWFIIAISKFRWAFVAVIAAAIQYAGINMFHQNLDEVILVSIAATGISLLLMVYPIAGEIIRIQRSK